MTLLELTETSVKITGTPPSLGLGTEKAPLDLMKKPPHSVKDGVFTWALILDTFAYGIVIGITCLISVGHEMTPPQILYS